jgi:hypothetical protein
MTGQYRDRNAGLILQYRLGFAGRAPGKVAGSVTSYRSRLHKVAVVMQSPSSPMLAPSSSPWLLYGAWINFTR